MNADTALSVDNDVLGLYCQCDIGFIWTKNIFVAVLMAMLVCQSLAQTEISRLLDVLTLNFVQMLIVPRG